MSAGRIITDPLSEARRTVDAFDAYWQAPVEGGPEYEAVVAAMGDLKTALGSTPERHPKFEEALHVLAGVFESVPDLPGTLDIRRFIPGTRPRASETGEWARFFDAFVTVLVVGIRYGWVGLYRDHHGRTAYLRVYMPGSMLRAFVGKRGAKKAATP